jgi:uncharacterized protein related to proFAR isomerase
MKADNNYNTSAVHWLIVDCLVKTLGTIHLSTTILATAVKSSETTETSHNENGIFGVVGFDIGIIMCD